MCLPVQEGVVKTIDQQIFRFLWGKRDRIKRRPLFYSIKEGGLNVIDTQTHFDAIKATWINRISKNDDEIWTYIPKMH